MSHLCARARALPLPLPTHRQRPRIYETVTPCCYCCFAAPQGYLKVSVRSGVPLTEEDLAELAFQGKGSPSPVGYVRVPKADLQGLERRCVDPFGAQKKTISPV